MSDEITDDVEIEENLDLDVDLDTSTDQDVTEYEPNYSYKVRDEERAFDERFRPVVTDKETEEALRDLYTRADGLDTYKQKVSAYEDSVRQHQERVSQLQGGFNTLKEYREKGDYRQLFNAIGVKNDDILKYAYSVAQEDELPEEQRTVIRQNREYQDRLSSLEAELQRQQSDRQRMSVDNDFRELESYVETNRELDSRMKEYGFNLRDEVVSYGFSATKLTGKEPSIAEATKAVTERFSKMLHSAVGTQRDIQSEINKRPKTLPRVNGTNATAPEEKITMDKLRQMAKAIV